MAEIKANRAFNIDAFNLNALLNYDSRTYALAANGDPPQMWNGISYADSVVFKNPLRFQQFDTQFFGGTGITIDPETGAILTGSITGHTKGVTEAFGTTSIAYSIEYFSIEGTLVWNAVLSSDKVDDLAVLARILQGTDTFSLSQEDDTVNGYAGVDTIRGNGGNDKLNGGVGNDFIDGGAGNDRLNGGRGGDLLFGGAGDDAYVIDDVADQVFETIAQPSTVDAGGMDTVSSSVDFNLESATGHRYIERLYLTGGANLTGVGNNLDNVIHGNNGNNTLGGRLGDDKLMGGAGADRLIGGYGRDVLYAGIDASADIFVFSAAMHSGPGAQRDVVHQFDSGEDKIGLSAIDADQGLAGNQQFSFSQGPAAHSVWTIDTGTSLIIRADVTGDATAELEIVLVNTEALASSDFQL